VRAGPGRDSIVIDAGSAFGGPGVDLFRKADPGRCTRMYGEAGNDHIEAQDQNPRTGRLVALADQVFCGPGRGFARLGARDTSDGTWETIDRPTR
jgi:hypothetical protein